MLKGSIFTESITNINCGNFPTIHFNSRMTSLSTDTCFNVIYLTPRPLEFFRFRYVSLLFSNGLTDFTESWNQDFLCDAGVWWCIILTPFQKNRTMHHEPCTFMYRIWCSVSQCSVPIYTRSRDRQNKTTINLGRHLQLNNEYAKIFCRGPAGWGPYQA